MSKLNYFNFMGGCNATIQSIVEQKDSIAESLTYFKVSLEEFDEIIRLSISSTEASKIKVGAVIAYSSTDLAIGYSLWKNGLGSFEMVTEGNRP